MPGGGIALRRDATDKRLESEVHTVIYESITILMTISELNVVNYYCSYQFLVVIRAEYSPDTSNT